jgi:hypothetical protein
MEFRKFLTEEHVGFAIGYTAAFVVDNFVKVSGIRYGYKTLDWVASKTKITQPTPQVLFERAVDAIFDAY